jgi:hypothetical protein
MRKKGKMSKAVRAGLKILYYKAATGGCGLVAADNHLPSTIYPLPPSAFPLHPSSCLAAASSIEIRRIAVARPV